MANDSPRENASEEAVPSPKRKSRKPEDSKRRNSKRITPVKKPKSKRFDLADLHSKEVLAELEKAIRSDMRTSSKLIAKSNVLAFKGSNLIDWLMRNVDFKERQEAVAFGARLWAKGLIESADSKWNPFYDDAHTYIFKNQREVERQLSRKSSNVRNYFERRTQQLANFSASSKEGWLAVQEAQRSSSGNKLKKPQWINRWCSLHQIEATEENDTNESEQTDEEAKDTTPKKRSKKKTKVDSEAEEAEESPPKTARKSRRKRRKKEKEAKAIKWEFVVYNAMWDSNDSELVGELTNPKTGVKLSKKGLKQARVKRTFKGSNAVDWCVKNNKSENREAAVDLLNRLMQSGIITPTTSTLKDMADIHFFEDSKKSRYRFKDQCFVVGQVRPTPLFRLNLSDIDFSMDEQGDYVLMILQDTASNRREIESTDQLNAPIRPNSLTIRIPKLEETLMQDWVVAVNNAILESSNEVLAAQLAATLEEGNEKETEDVELLTKEKRRRKKRKKQRKTKRSEKEEEEETEETGETDAEEDELLKAEMAKVHEMRRVLEAEKKEEIEAGNEDTYGIPASYPDLRFDWSTMPDRVLLKCLRARRLTIPRAVRLLKMCVPFRMHLEIDKTRIDTVARLTPSLGILAVEAKDVDGRPLVFLNAKNYLPKHMPAEECVRAMLYFFDIASEEYEDSVTVQRIGITCVADMKGAGIWRNFDPKAVPTLVNGILGHYPIRIGHIIVMNPPRVFNMVWKVIKPLLPEDILNKVHILDKPEDVFEYVTRENMLQSMGGDLEFDGEAWVDERFKKEGIIRK
eukprot:TRINITY_DN172_c0_g1_i1.p1 TRINITY_DN172_c0_g1~~TRINITY_DN172_c0_g1_i1.p1  ORF type:complete len:888 (+),score=179.11 TRINITY_DN172_c0_g1_i1:262-2664(+)